MAQFNTGNNAFQNSNKTLFEVNQLATANGMQVSNSNPLPVTLGSESITITGSVTAVADPVSGNFYREPYAVPITPVVQQSGTYGINSRDIQTYTSSGGSATTSNGCYVVTSTSTVGSYGLLRSRRFNAYKPGQSLIARFLSKFSTPAANTSQRIGLNNQESSYWVGYNGTTFGVCRSNGGMAPIYELTITSYTGNQTVTLTLNGVAYTISINTGETINNAAQRIALNSLGGLWLATQKDNKVELLYNGTNAALGGTFSVSGSGDLVASLSQLQVGAVNVDTWYTDGVDFTKPSFIVPDRFVQYEIKYSWAGISFFALNPSTGVYELFYNLIWAGTSNASILPVTHPVFKIAALALNAGGSSGVRVDVASMMAGLEGITNRNNYSGGAITTQTSLATGSVWHLLSIQNPYAFASDINLREALLQDLTLAAQVNDPMEVMVYMDAPLLTGIHDFKSQDGYSVTVSTVTGTIDPDTNFPILTFVTGTTGSSVQFNLEPYRVVLSPGSTINIAVRSTATIQKASAGIVWYND